MILILLVWEYITGESRIWLELTLLKSFARVEAEYYIDGLCEIYAYFKLIDHYFMVKINLNKVEKTCGFTLNTIFTEY